MCCVPSIYVLMFTIFEFSRHKCLTILWLTHLHCITRYAIVNISTATATIHLHIYISSLERIAQLQMR